MASHLKDWVGPLVEGEIQAVIASRFSQDCGDALTTAGTTSVRLQDRDIDSHDQYRKEFNEDHSTLIIGSYAPPDRARVVQLLDVLSDKPLKWLVCDGYTTITAKVPHSTQQAFRREADRDASDLRRLILLSISSLDIRATVHGKTDERIQFQINHVQLFSTSRNGPPGNLRDIHQRNIVIQLMGELKQVYQDRRSQLEERDSGRWKQYQSRPSVIHDGGTTGTAGMPSGGSQDNQKSSALNLAPPVMAQRGNASKSSIGARTPIRKPIFSGLMSQIKDDNHHHEAAHMSGGSELGVREHRVWKGARAEPQDTSSSKIATGTRRTTIIPNDSFAHTSGNLEVSSNSISSCETHDLTKENGLAAVVDQRLINAQGLIAQRLRRKSSDQTSQPSGDVENCIHVKQEPKEEGRSSHLPSTIITKATISADPQEQEHSGLSNRLSQPMAFLATTHSSPKSVANSGPSVSWLPDAAVLRAPCIIAEEQLALLQQDISWNPPIPPGVFPSPNIPRLLLEQLERDASGPGDKNEDIESDSVSSSELSASSSDTSDDDPLSGWHSSPEQPSEAFDRGKDLPPDSSHIAVESSNDENQNRSSGRIVTAPESPVAPLSALSIPKQSNITNLQEQSSRPITSQKVLLTSPRQLINNSSVTQPSMRRSGNLNGRSNVDYESCQPSTLPESAFASPEQPHSYRRGHGDEERPMSYTYTPDFQSGQAIARRLFPVVDQDSSMPTSEVDTKMAEQQLQRESQASTREPTTHEGHPLQHQEPGSHLAALASLTRNAGSTQQSHERGDAGATILPNVLGKHAPSSPLSPGDRPQQKSRFGFSQEEPLSQDPATLAKVERKNFMRQKAAQNQQRRAQQNPTDNVVLPRELPSATIVAPNTPLRSNATIQISGQDFTSSPPLPVSLALNLVSPQAIAATQLPLHELPHSFTRSGDQVEPDISNTASLRPVITPTARSVFQEMKQAYPVYDEEKNFVHFSNLTSRLNKIKHFTHRFLWDDFVIRYKTDWLPYSHQCLEDGIETMNYEQYYLERIESPLYTAGILNDARMDAMFPKHDRYIGHSQIDADQDHAGQDESTSRDDDLNRQYSHQDSNEQRLSRKRDMFLSPKSSVINKSSVVVARLDGSNRRRQESGPRAQNPFFARSAHGQEITPNALSSSKRMSNEYLPESSYQTMRASAGASNTAAARIPHGPKNPNTITTRAGRDILGQRLPPSDQSHQPMPPSSRPGSGPSPKRPKGGRRGGRRF